MEMVIGHIKPENVFSNHAVKPVNNTMSTILIAKIQSTLNLKTLITNNTFRMAVNPCAVRLAYEEPNA
jgi:hypothetical protein